MQWILIGGVMVVVVGLLVLRERKKHGGASRSKKKVTPSLQEFLPIEKFDPSGAVIVNGRYRRLIHIGDLNLFSMATEEIRAARDRFKNMLMRLDNPFQISVQARRANYTDFVDYARSTMTETTKAYGNEVFTEYANELLRYLQDEAQKPRTDRENLFVVTVLPKMGGEEAEAQLERLDQEQAYVEQGFSSIGVPYQTLDAVEVVEAVQNFWDRDRAVSQRYRDALRRRTHAPRVEGDDEMGGTMDATIQPQKSTGEEGVRRGSQRIG